VLRTESKRKERILVFGAPKSGKTRTWASIVESNSPTKVYAQDTDYRAPQSLEHIPGWEDFVVLTQPSSWEELVEATDKALFAMEENDWLVFDMIGQAWSYVITYYIEQVMGKKPSQFFLDFKMGGGKGNPMAGAYGENWNIINSIYRDWIGKVLRCKGHVLAVCQSKKIDLEQDDTTTKKLFGPYGVKPDGQKDLGYQFDSVLLTGFGRSSSDYTITSVGDTNRVKVVEKPLHNFTIDYLVQQGGWKL
jgi:hypothetical protein